jgi:accessory colonization factor AcfC
MSEYKIKKLLNYINYLSKAPRTSLLTITKTIINSWEPKATRETKMLYTKKRSKMINHNKKYHQMAIIRRNSMIALKRRLPTNISHLRDTMTVVIDLLCYLINIEFIMTY